MPERFCIPGAQASQQSSPQPAGLVCAARRDARTLAQALTLAAAELDWLPDSRHWKPGHVRNRFRVPLRPRTPSRLLFIWGCSSQSHPRCQTDSSPSLASLWNLSHHTTPQTSSSSLGQPSMPPSCYKIQDSQALPPGRPSLR